MKWSLILSISKTHLLSRKKQSIIAALGVTFGIGTYIIMMSFMTGLNQLLDGLILNRTPHIHLFNEVEPTKDQPVSNLEKYKDYVHFVESIKPTHSRQRIHNALPILEFLNKQSSVKGANAQVKSTAFYLGGSAQLNGVLTGIDVMKEKELYALDDYIIDGTLQSLAKNESGVLLGVGVAKKLSLQVGDIIQIATTKADIIPLKIVGFYQSGIADVDNVQSYVNLKMAQRIMGESKNYITDINIKLHDLSRAPELSKDFARMFDVTAIDIETANAQFETGTTIRTMISYAVSITLLIVAGFGIYNILNMLIYEKMNDIAILKATGFSGRDVRMIFISQAIIIGLIGGAVGLIIGYFVSVIISHTPFDTEALPTVKTYPVNFDSRFYVIGIVFAMISTFLAGFFPANKAAKIDPVEIIRGQ